MTHTWVSSQAAAVPTTYHSGSFASRRSIGVHKRQENANNWKFARGLFFLFAFLILFSGFTLVHTFASSGEVAHASSNEIVITVDTGDTMWQLARAYKKDSMDTRQAVHEIAKRNGLSNTTVRVGQSLILPERILP
ncbi:LysM peptidoglycan-binding domain-containing protein [Cohnella endophytica]|uniref:LysM peptidoglycan-binding domain-containing protein n=1 Tax=Cohnella endophytica TaxID=2419778 RepID=A0A494Y3R3_9BACL|nr:LysM peptidoglycan-binding domain-containing protein [Cohnella endophytica]RKP56931.1 LysM peptidoglycan-binding domain-containing protein [Cohnella endophytica]